MGSLCSTPAAPADEQVVESVVCKVSDLVEGTPKQFKVGDKACLVVKHKGHIHAVSDKCTHYGASLCNGAFSDGIVRCPWHGACFNVETGDIEDFPGLDSLHKFQVEVDSGEVKVRAKKSQLASTKVTKAMCKRDEANTEEAVVIIGGGPAAETCAETLRQTGFTGRVTMLTMEQSPPYERIKLSKTPAASAESLRLRTQDFYNDADIEVRTASLVVRVNTDENEVQLADGRTIGYSKLVIASGCTATKLGCPGADLTNVFALRSPEDANSIAAAAGKDKHVVVLGTSFIGMEVAAYFANKTKSVTVVGRSLPFERSLGGEIGRYFKSVFENKGVRFEIGTSISEINESGSNPGEVGSVMLANGSKVDADVVVCGIGVTPNTDFLRNCGVSLSAGGYVAVDEFMGTSVPNVWAAGDVVSFPLFFADWTKVSIGHWQLAHALGRNAALNVMAKKEAIRSVPFFWTVLFGMSLRYAGHASQGFDDILYEGSVADGSFAAYYCKGDNVVAVSTLKKDPRAAQFANLLKEGRNLTKKQVNQEWYLHS